MYDVEIFYKTELGRMAVSDRSYGLHQRLRAALILIDGKTAWSGLGPMLGSLGNPEDIVQKLAELGLVESDHSLPPTPVIQAAFTPVANPAVTVPV